MSLTSPPSRSSDVGEDGVSLHCEYSNTQPAIAYRHLAGTANCAVLYLPGFRSSMTGRKSNFLQKYCYEGSLEYVCFDYRAYGESQGDCAVDGTITNWLQDALWILENVVQSPRVFLVGSSMGGWLALLVTQRLLERIAGLVLLAPAVDMTRYYPDPIRHRQRPQQDNEGRVFYQVPNAYDDQEPYIMYDSLLKDGEQHLLLDTSPLSALALERVPIHILHGTKDGDFPPHRSKLLMEKFLCNNSDATLTLIEGGDHRLSGPQHLEMLRQCLDNQVGHEI